MIEWDKLLRALVSTLLVAFIMDYPAIARASASELQKHTVTYEDIEGAAEPSGFDISNDGRQIAYVRRGAIFVKRIDDASGALKIADGTAPKWSPDASRLAFYAPTSGRLQLWGPILPSVIRSRSVLGGSAYFLVETATLAFWTGYCSFSHRSIASRCVTGTTRCQLTRPVRSLYSAIR